MTYESVKDTLQHTFSHLQERHIKINIYFQRIFTIIDKAKDVLTKNSQVHNQIFKWEV